MALAFIDHLLEEMSSRFSEDIRTEAEIFSLVPSAVVKHDSLRNLAEKLQFWQQESENTFQRRERRQKRI